MQGDQFYVTGTNIDKYSDGKMEGKYNTKHRVLFGKTLVWLERIEERRDTHDRLSIVIDEVLDRVFHLLSMGYSSHS